MSKDVEFAIKLIEGLIERSQSSEDDPRNDPYHRYYFMGRTSGLKDALYELERCSNEK